ncbi:hypothetical protein EVAR_20023_1 [Eumeta japonica]|uniref:Uncharacterized protein n=1 Tax=Eumeta variegata TaxID=151549 RepID=A0A4C1V9U8_EUMVA|nr:hypothetical protein EVAR_20023_1 [Eumeta japonica]
MLPAASDEVVKAFRLTAGPLLCYFRSFHHGTYPLPSPCPPPRSRPHPFARAVTLAARRIDQRLMHLAGVESCIKPLQMPLPGCGRQISLKQQKRTTSD